MSFSLYPFLEKKMTGDYWTKVCRETFYFQFKSNRIYRRWCEAMGVDCPDKVSEISHIPFLPVEVFKSNRVLSGFDFKESMLFFRSSSTTSSQPSFHAVADPSLYQESIEINFQQRFGNIHDYVFVGLLPGYLERGNASLVYMVDFLCRKSHHPESRIFSSGSDAYKHLVRNAFGLKKIFIIGITYAIMDLVEYSRPLLTNPIILVETGGMKGTRKEMSRNVLHSYLKSRWSGITVLSEYGMTELLSQGWTREGEDWFYFPPWVRPYVRSVTDPMEKPSEQGRGQLLIIDLANRYSCSFLATQDVAEVEEGRMRWLGRTDFSEIRGCNLMYETFI